MRFALAAVLALVIGSQADAQLIRRYARPAYYPAYNEAYAVSPSYATPGTVVTAGYYSPSTWSNNYVYPSSYYSPMWSTGYSNLGYTNSGYSNYRYNSGYGWRRGYRW